MAKVHAGLALHGTAYFAHDQLAGKGQRGKHGIPHQVKIIHEYCIRAALPATHATICTQCCNSCVML